jgi:murein DD-endopeptidase MepM/ murein hydrolase activator NlpD
MRQAAYLSGYGRGAFGVAAVALLGLALAGCSSSVSRFDFPSFSLTGNDTASNAGNADLASTAALPPVVPEEPVYSSGEGSSRLTRANLPPPDYSPRPAAYTPAPSGRVAAAEANYPAQAAPRPEPAVLRANVAGARVKVEKGDTLSNLSRRYGVSVEKIMAANNLPDGRLSVGQQLIIPGAKQPKPVEAAAAPLRAPGQSTYKVRKGDTPHSIADKLDVSEQALIQSNKLNPNNLRVGQTLVVPSKSAKPLAATNDDTPLAEPAVDASPNVRKVKTTTIPAPGTSLAEEEDNAYGADAKPAKSAGKTQDSAADDIPASPEVTGPGSQRVASSNDQLPTPEPMSGNSFRWPVKGRVIAEFGARPDGGHNDGIDVAVPQGTLVKAAENGVVAYAGNELKGYGNLVLIRHANNWVSAYANNEEILVKRGDKVTRGQSIAKAGATGSVSQPQVHFELRKGSRPVDPTKYMSDQAANAD